MMAPGSSLQAPSLPGGHNPNIPTIGEGPEGQKIGRNAHAWSKTVPTERMDLTPNE